MRHLSVSKRNLTALQQRRRQTTNGPELALRRLLAAPSAEV